MEIRYSHHARDVKMPQRKIAQEEVEAVIEAPAFTTPAYSPNQAEPRVNLWRRVGGRLLRVTIAESTEWITVVTVVAPDEEQGRMEQK